MLPASKYSILPDSRLDSCLACMIKLCPLLALWLQASAAVGSLAPLECPQKKNTTLIHRFTSAGSWQAGGEERQISSSSLFDQ